MPKIKIREYDLTQPGTATYSNFSVLVPGFTQNKSNEDEIFDENGIAEFTSAADFEKYAGLISPEIENIPGVGPEFDAFPDGGVYEKVSEDDFEGKYMNKLYTRKQLSELDVKFRKLTESGYLLSRTTDEAGEIIFLEFTKATTWDKDTQYVIISPGKEGTNGYNNAKGHLGNEIAYYLLTLGYTVLYKKFQPTEDENENGEIVNALDGKITDLMKAEFWEPLKDKALYDFRYIVSGMMSNITKSENKDIEEDVTMGAVNAQMIALAEFNNSQQDPYKTGRGDCFVLCDIPKDSYTYNNKAYVGRRLITAIKEGVTQGSTYAAYFCPTVTYTFDPGNVFGHNSEFPASFHYLACAAKAFQNFNEWYAVAGFTRGVSNYVVKSLSAKIGDFALNELQPRSGGNAVNVITNIKGNYYIWGNRTSLTIGPELVAQDFLNIRQLVTSIKKDLYVKCRRFTFDPNSDTLWINFCNSITPLLDRMKGDQGIKDYTIVRGKTDLKATFKAIIRIVPIEAVEDFDLTINLEDSITGTVVHIDD